MTVTSGGGICGGGAAFSTHALSKTETKQSAATLEAGLTRPGNVCFRVMNIIRPFAGSAPIIRLDVFKRCLPHRRHNKTVWISNTQWYQDDRWYPEDSVSRLKQEFPWLG